MTDERPHSSNRDSRESRDKDWKKGKGYRDRPGKGKIYGQNRQNAWRPSKGGAASWSDNWRSSTGSTPPASSVSTPTYETTPWTPASPPPVEEERESQPVHSPPKYVPPHLQPQRVNGIFMGMNESNGSQWLQFRVLPHNRDVFVLEHEMKFEYQAGTRVVFSLSYDAKGNPSITHLELDPQHNQPSPPSRSTTSGCSVRRPQNDNFDEKRLSQGRIRMFPANRTWGIIMIEVINEEETTNQLRPGSELIFQAEEKCSVNEGDTVAFDVRRKPNSNAYVAVNVTKLDGLDAKACKLENVAENKLALGHSADITDLAINRDEEGGSKKLGKSRLLTIKISSLVASGQTLAPVPPARFANRQRPNQLGQEFFQQIPRPPEGARLDERPHTEFVATDTTGQHAQPDAALEHQPSSFSHDSTSSVTAESGAQYQRRTQKILLQKPPFMERFDLAEIASNLINNKVAQQYYSLRYAAADPNSEAAEIAHSMARLLLNIREEDRNDEERRRKEMMKWSSPQPFTPPMLSVMMNTANSGSNMAPLARGHDHMSIQQAMNQQLMVGSKPESQQLVQRGQMSHSHISPPPMYGRMEWVQLPPGQIPFQGNPWIAPGQAGMQMNFEPTDQQRTPDGQQMFLIRPTMYFPAQQNQGEW